MSLFKEFNNFIFNKLFATAQNSLLSKAENA